MKRLLDFPPNDYGMFSIVYLYTARFEIEFYLGDSSRNASFI